MPVGRLGSVEKQKLPFNLCTVPHCCYSFPIPSVPSCFVFLMKFSKFSSNNPRKSELTAKLTIQTLTHILPVSPGSKEPVLCNRLHHLMVHIRFSFRSLLGRGYTSSARESFCYCNDENWVKFSLKNKPPVLIPASV